MKNGFYMGYDASALKEQELLAQAENLLNLGFYSAGYDVLRLGDAGRFENAEALATYATHPAHVAVADGKVRPYTAVRSCLDFEA